ncbi:Uncharacterized membrane protein YkgB [Rhizobiales bacterium GAS191]|jgi:uncharacterized membrane protein YkgB|nr:Uncharacterized membrane protein YkgB [Rhizobiales bacterium GAS113]SEE67739.1 Uncharacterized membrane protein YkgB [Rhizobiales bacterium GAS191]
MRTNEPALEDRLTKVGGAVLRYSLVLFFVGFGLFKFTPQEAAGIQPLVANSPLLSWIYRLLDLRAGSGLIGIVEITLGVLIALRQVNARLSAYGSLGTALVLCITLSFLFTTKGLDPQSSDAGFLLKDLTLLGAALWTAGEALRAANTDGAVDARAGARLGRTS